MISPPGPGRLRMVSAQAWLRNNNNDSIEEKKRFHTLAEKLVELSRKKVEVAKEEWPLLPLHPPPAGGVHEQD